MSFIPALKPNTPPMPSEIQTLKAWRATNDYAARLSQAQADTVALSAKVEAAQDALTAAYQSNSGIDKARATLEDSRAQLEEAQFRLDALLEGEEATVTAAAAAGVNEAAEQAGHALGEKQRVLASLAEPLEQLNRGLADLEAADRDANRWNRAVTWLANRSGVARPTTPKSIESIRLTGALARECKLAVRILRGETVI